MFFTEPGVRRRKWDRSGLVVEVLPHNKYLIKIDGSGRLTARNRRFLRLYKPPSTFLDSVPSIEELGSCNDADMPDEHEFSFRAPQVPAGNDGGVDCRDDLTSGVVDLNDNSDVGGSPPAENPIDSSESTSATLDTGSRLPLAVRRLQRHNNPGMKEDLDPVRTRLRKK